MPSAQWPRPAHVGRAPAPCCTGWRAPRTAHPPSPRTRLRRGWRWQCSLATCASASQRTAWTRT
eukprot:2910839-Prymnesium_polylepis.1